MKVNQIEKPHKELKPGDVLGCKLDDQTDYFLILRTADDKYALVTLASTEDGSTGKWLDNGNLTIDGTFTLKSDGKLVDSIKDLVWKLKLTYDSVEKVNISLNVQYKVETMMKVEHKGE